MPRTRDLTSLAAALLLSATIASAGQTPATPAEGTASFTIFAGTTPIGSVEMTVARAGDGWRISSTGQQRAPVPLTINDFEVTYAPDWHPRAMKLDAVLRDQGVTLATTFN